MRVFRVRSKSNPAVFYRIVETARGLQCNCPAGCFNRKCRHKKIVEKYRKEVLKENW